MTTSIDDLISARRAQMSSAMSTIQRGLTAAKGAGAAEERYGAAHDDLVRLGAEPMLRRKYRTGRALKKVR